MMEVMQDMSLLLLYILLVHVNKLSWDVCRMTKVYETVTLYIQNTDKKNKSNFGNDYNIPNGTPPHLV